MSESVRVRCEYPGCTKDARVMNEGGFWCHHPHVVNQPEPSPIPDHSTRATERTEP